MLLRLMFVVILSFLAAACSRIKDIPTEFPTPPPKPAATPIAKLVLKPDAELEKEFAKIAEDAKGKVGAMAVVLETGESAGLNADQKFPMQSVYKLPIAMAVLDKVRLGELDLDEQIGVGKDDMVRRGFRSPLRDENPEGGEFTIRELIRLAIVESDGTANDALLRLAGGAAGVQAYLTQIGVRDMKIAYSEKEIGRDWQTQYESWATPAASVELLRYLNTQWEAVPPDQPDTVRQAGEARESWLLHQFMVDSGPGERRLKALLERGTIVAHKTGTGGNQNGIASATNDIGVIELPNGKHIAVAVYISDSTESLRGRENVIARIAKAAWDRWAQDNH